MIDAFRVIVLMSQEILHPCEISGKRKLNLQILSLSDILIDVKSIYTLHSPALLVLEMYKYYHSPTFWSLIYSRYIGCSVSPDSKSLGWAVSGSPRHTHLHSPALLVLKEITENFARFNCAITADTMGRELNHDYFSSTRYAWQVYGCSTSYEQHMDNSCLMYFAGKYALNVELYLCLRPGTRHGTGPLPQLIVNHRVAIYCPLYNRYLCSVLCAIVRRGSLQTWLP